MRLRKISLTTKYIAIISLLILAVNFFLGMVMLNQSKNTMKTLIARHMEDTAQDAALLINGTELAFLTEDHMGTEDFDRINEQIKQSLLVFMNNDTVHFVYVVKKSDPSNEYEFEFVVDPDPDDPAELGEEVVVTDGLRRANEGIVSVDSEKVADEWGCYYSAWCPIYDSEERTKEHIVGIVGVDFDADWYDSQASKHTLSVIVISVLSVIACGSIVLIITLRVRKRFRSLSGELTGLSADIESLTEEITSSPGFSERLGTGERHTPEEDLLVADESPKEVNLDNEDLSNDAIESLGNKIRLIQKELHTYIDFVHAQAFADTMTGVGSKTAYLETVKKLDAGIVSGDAAFSIVVFDVNGLKNTNDNFGHEIGDRLLIDSATVIKRVFGADSVYRIGGDEFIAVLEGTNEEELKSLFADLDEEFALFNEKEKQHPVPISVSKGGATFDKDSDTEFRIVFKRADEEMYKDKAAFYQKNKDRRQRPQ